MQNLTVPIDNNHESDSHAKNPLTKKKLKQEHVTQVKIKILKKKPRENQNSRDPYRMSRPHERTNTSLFSRKKI